MKLKTQVILLTSLSIFTAVALTSWIAIYFIQEQGKRNIYENRQTALQQVDSALIDDVEMAYQTLASQYDKYQSPEYLIQIYGQQLEERIEILEQLIRQQKVKPPATQADQIRDAQSRFRIETETMIRTLRRRDSSAYFWVQDTILPYPSLVISSEYPDWEGKPTDDARFYTVEPNRDHLFQKIASLCRKKGQGFVLYRWPAEKDDSLRNGLPTLAYAKLSPEDGHIYGTYVHLKEAQQRMIQEMRETILAMSKQDKDGYFWIMDNSLPYPKMLLWPKNDQLEGVYLGGENFPTLNGRDKGLFAEISERCNQQGSVFTEYWWYSYERVTNTKAEFDLLKRAYSKIYTPLNWILSTSADITPIEEELQRMADNVHQHTRQAILYILLTALVLLLIGIWIAIYFANYLTNAIITVKDKLKILALGKAVEKIEVKQNNELGEMGKSLNQLVTGFNSYTEFAKEIGEGNLDQSFQPLSDEDVLGNELLQMRSGLKKASKEEEKRSWHSEGMALFNEILRQNNQSIRDICLESLRQLVKYLGVQQGGIFLLEATEEEAIYLDLKACFAYDRQKFLQKQILLGEGLLGQCALEQETTYLTEIPDHYANIGTGLGDSKPSTILLVPLAHNEVVQGVLELASLNPIPEHHLAFVEQLSETIAATIAYVRNNEQTQELLEQSQKLSENLRAQEEELRQNQEELEATQEEMRRKQEELENENRSLKEKLHTLRSIPWQKMKNGHGNGHKTQGNGNGQEKDFPISSDQNQ